jgi:hypothetical protein
MSETENSMDTEESTAASTSAEDRFFGVKTKVVKTPDKQEVSEQADLSFEIADDKLLSDKKAADDDDTDDELSGYSKKVRKRLDKATFKRREAERLADEAVKAAQQLNQQNQQLIISSSKRFISNSKRLTSNSKRLTSSLLLNRLQSQSQRQKNGERKILGLGTGGIRG